MKKILLTLLALFIIKAGFMQSNIPNGDLENWFHVPVNATLSYDQPGTSPYDNFLYTLNELASIPTPLGPGPVTAFKEPDAHSGSYACKLVSAMYINLGIFIPGMLGTDSLDMTGQRAILGKPCAGCKPVSLKGYYKFTAVSGDSCAAVCLVSKWNATTKHRDTVGFGASVFKTDVETYTAFDVPLTYAKTVLVPDSITILCVASAGFSVINFQGGVGQAGNTMYVDDLMLEYPAGIEQTLMPDVNVKVYPDPAKETLTFETSQMVKSGMIEVYNSGGKMLQTFGLNGLKNSFSVSNLSNGVYYFKLKESNHLLNAGSFVVQK